MAGRSGRRPRGTRRDRRPRGDPRSRHVARGRRCRRRSTRPGSWSRRGSSTCTSTCASPGTRTPRRWRAGWRRRPTAASRPSARCRTRHPALDEPGVLAQVRAAAAASGSPIELLAHGAVTAGRHGETLAALGELADAGVVGFSDDGAPVRVRLDPARRARLCRGTRAADRGPPRGSDPDRGRRGERRVRGDRAGPARVAGRGRGGRGRAGPRDPRRRRARRPRRPAAPDARLLGRRARPRPPRKGGRLAGHVRRDAAPPRPDRRVAGGRSPLGMGRDRGPVGGRRARRRPVRPVAAGQPAPSRAGGRGRGDLRRSWTGRPTRSPPTTPPTPRSTRRSSSGSAANGISGIETALGAAAGRRRCRLAAARALDRGADDRSGPGPRGPVASERDRRARRRRSGRPRGLRPVGRPGP